MSEAFDALMKAANKNYAHIGDKLKRQDADKKVADNKVKKVSPQKDYTATPSPQTDNEVIPERGPERENGNEVSDPVNKLPSDPVTQWPSDPRAYPGTCPGTYPVTQLSSDPVGNLPSSPVTQWPSDPLDNIPSGPVTQWPSDPVGHKVPFRIPAVDWSRKPEDLKTNQYEVLHFIYFNRPFKIRGSNRILPHIAESTVRYCLRNSLIKKGYILELFGINDGVNVGTSCQVNESLCVPLFGPSPVVNSEQLPKRKTCPMTQWPSDPLDNLPSDPVTQWPSDSVNTSPSDPVVPSYSSSSLNKNLLLARELEDALKNNPELAYWKRNNLKGRRVENWIAETGISLEEMIESLAHCAFEMIRSDEKDKKGKPITSVFDWFWRRIEKHHYYDRPTGYISAEDRKIERAKKRLAETQARAKEMERIRVAEEAAQMDIRFEEMLKDPEGELYRKCYEGMSSFQKKRTKTPQGLATAMRRRFDKIMEEDAQK